MKTIVGKLTYVLLFVIFAPCIAYGQNAYFSKQQVLEDVTYLQEVLTDKHPNIHIYTSKDTFSAFFENLIIDERLTAQEAYRLIATSNLVIQDGHTLYYPSKKWREDSYTKGSFIPFQPFWDGSKWYVAHNYRASDELKEGMQILAINGIKSEEIIQDMLGKMMRDGNNDQYPIWVLNAYFYEYYSYFYGFSDIYEVKVDDGMDEKTLILQGMAKSDLLQIIQNQQEGKGITLHVDQANSTGVLTIKSWNPLLIKKYHRQRLMSALKKAVNQIERANIQNLIIDVRNNQGGETKYARYLLSYLLSEPFVLVEQYYKKQKGTVVSCRGPQQGVHQPMGNTFKGNVYVLINGGSFSNTGIFCSVLRKYKRAIFIGEETGGSEFVICGHTKDFILPQTGIQVIVPRLQFRIKSQGEGAYHGVIPDYFIQPDIDDILNHTDKDLTFALKLIQRRK
ncbi:MAG: S41 family peptidase [Bacteroidota bacterium]